MKVPVTFLLWDAIVDMKDKKLGDRLNGEGIINLPYMPQIGMKMNLMDFAGLVGFTDEEQDAMIEDAYYVIVKDVYMNPECVDLYFEKI